MNLDRLKNLRADMGKCFRCSLCKMVPLPVVRHPQFTDACPASRFYHFHGFSGSGKQILALSLLDGRIQPDPALARIVFACTTCGYCDVACKFIMDAERQQVNLALREYLASLGLAPPALRPSNDDLQTCDYPSEGARPLPRLWSEGLPLARLPRQKAQVLLLAGCRSQSDPGAAGVARKLARLLIQAGVEVGILGEAEPGCGLPAYWAGHRERFARMAAQAVSVIEALGVATVVLASGSCLGAWRGKYPEYARAPKVKILHATEFLARLLEQGRLKLPRPVPAKVTFHDPCYLGRQSEPFVAWTGEEKVALGVMTYTEPPKPINRGVNGVYDPPRQLLRAIPGLEFTEMYRIREYAFCCGGGGGVPLAFPEMARAAAWHRLEEAKAVGAERLVTACSHCRQHLLQSQQVQKTPSLEIADIIDLLFEASGLKD
jgi:Fe-S oxidoreductase